MVILSSTATNKSSPRAWPPHKIVKLCIQDRESCATTPGELVRHPVHQLSCGQAPICPLQPLVSCASELRDYAPISRARAMNILLNSLPDPALPLQAGVPILHTHHPLAGSRLHFRANTMAHPAIWRSLSVLPERHMLTKLQTRLHTDNR